MRRAAFLPVVLLLGVWPSQATAGCQDLPRCAVLKNLAGVRILIEHLSKDTKSIGVTGKGLEGLVLVTLRAKLPRVKVTPLLLGFPVIYVRVTAIRGAAAVEVKLRAVPCPG